MARFARSQSVGPRLRYEKYFLLTLLVITVLSLCRIPHLKQANAFYAIVTTRQAIRGNSVRTNNPSLSSGLVGSAAYRSLGSLVGSRLKHEKPGTASQLPLRLGFDTVDSGSTLQIEVGIAPKVVQSDSVQEHSNLTQKAFEVGNARSVVELDKSTSGNSAQIQVQVTPPVTFARSASVEVVPLRATDVQPANAAGSSDRTPDESGTKTLSKDNGDIKGVNVKVSGELLDAHLSQKIGQTVAVDNAERLPLGFDWTTYLLYHPDLRGAGIATEEAAKLHYLVSGRSEGRLYKRIRVVLRYTACTGLMNQQYSHLAAFSLAAMLGAEVVLPPAACRDSFGKHFSVYKEKNEMSWSAAPAESLLDVEKLKQYWYERGIVVHPTPGLHPFPDLTAPEVAYPAYEQPEIDATRVVKLAAIYLANRELNDLVESVRAAIMEHAGKLLRADHNLDLDYMVIDLPCTFFMLKTTSNLPLVGEVAKSLEFAPAIVSLAQTVIAGVTKGGQRKYNALHLRIEKDAQDWSIIMGGQGVVWKGYVNAMARAGFTASLPLYIASGLLTYGALQEMEHTEAVLRSTNLCGELVYKELFMPRDELDALNSEQKALLDFIVLANGVNFVGFGSSTFSFYLRELRALYGIPKTQSVLVDASVIGTDALFNSAGTLV